MWRIDASEYLSGGTLTTEDDEEPYLLDQGIVAKCGNCEQSLEVTREYSSHRYHKTIPCYWCEHVIAIRYGDDPFLPPWEICDLSAVVPSDEVEVNGHEWSFSVFDEQSDELTPVHKAGDCLSRATSLEFFGEGHYEMNAMNAVVLAEPTEMAVGYLTWNTFESETSTYPTLRQLYLMPAYRRCGLGTALVTYWLDHVVDSLVADTPNQTYCVESPNESMKALICNLGHDAENGGPTASSYTPGVM